ncbi:MAG: ABC-type uncharacterized transport system auxiliary subunit [Halieaceae bacterium]
MNKLFFSGLCLLPLLAGCLSLPGSGNDPIVRYGLQAPDLSCSTGRGTLGLSIAKLGSGLDTDRVARRNADSGEITYLKGVRWVDRVGVMLEQRLAADLECLGHTVITSHHSKLNHDNLVCEVRALNLVVDGDNDMAEVGLSCVLFVAAGDGDINIQSRHSGPMHNWSASSATAAIASSYQQVLQELATRLEPQPL